MNIAQFLGKLKEKGKPVSTRAKGTDETGTVYTVSADTMLTGDTLTGMANEAARAGVNTKVGFKREVEGVAVAHSGRADGEDAREVWAGLSPVPTDVKVNTAGATRPNVKA